MGQTGIMMASEAYFMIYFWEALALLHMQLQLQSKRIYSFKGLPLQTHVARTPFVRKIIEYSGSKIGRASCRERV